MELRDGVYGGSDGRSGQRELTKAGQDISSLNNHVNHFKAFMTMANIEHTTNRHEMQQGKCGIVGR